MARVTVEDCLKNVKNRFELVLLASKRARQLMRGKEPRVEWDNDKATVVALREIAAGYTDFDHVEKEIEQDPFMGFIEQKAVVIAEVEVEEVDVEEDKEELAADSAEEKTTDSTEGESGELTEENQTPAPREE